MKKQAMRDILIFWLGLIGCILVIGYYMVIKAAADTYWTRTQCENPTACGEHG